MFRALLVKELREHVLSLRFQAGFLLTFLIFCASATILSVQNRAMLRDHDEKLIRQDEAMLKYAHYNRVGAILQASRPPSAMVLVRGLASDAGTESLWMDPLAELSGSLDLSAVAGTILSLFGVALGYEAVNGEKERRTLGMILANRVMRRTVLLAKWAGGIVLIVVAVVPSALAGAVLVLAIGGASWSAAVWFSYSAACGAALLYASSFFSFAIALSAFCRSSALSALAALFGWVAGVFIAPNVSPYVAAQFVRVPAIAALERDVRFITSEERDQLGQAAQDRIMQAYSGLWPAGMTADGRAVWIQADPERRRAEAAMRAEVEEAWRMVNRTQVEKADRLLASWKARSDQQFRLSRLLSCAVSPYPPVLFALTELSATGVESKAHFERQAKAFDGVIGEYLETRYREEKTKDPSFDVNDFLDISTRPRFTYVEPAFAERLGAAAPYICILAIWNGLLLAAALMLFARFDVR